VNIHQEILEELRKIREKEEVEEEIKKR